MGKQFSTNAGPTNPQYTFPLERRPEASVNASPGPANGRTSPYTSISKQVSSTKATAPSLTMGIEYPYKVEDDADRAGPGRCSDSSSFSPTPSNVFLQGVRRTFAPGAGGLDYGKKCSRFPKQRPATDRFYDPVTSFTPSNVVGSAARSYAAKDNSRVPSPAIPLPSSSRPLSGKPRVVVEAGARRAGSGSGNGSAKKLRPVSGRSRQGAAAGKPSPYAAASPARPGSVRQGKGSPKGSLRGGARVGGRGRGAGAPGEALRLDSDGDDDGIAVDPGEDDESFEREMDDIVSSAAALMAMDSIDVPAAPMPTSPLRTPLRHAFDQSRPSSPAYSLYARQPIMAADGGYFNPERYENVATIFGQSATDLSPAWLEQGPANRTTPLQQEWHAKRGKSAKKQREAAHRMHSAPWRLSPGGRAPVVEHEHGGAGGGGPQGGGTMQATWHADGLCDSTPNGGAWQSSKLGASAAKGPRADKERVEEQQDRLRALAASPKHYTEPYVDTRAFERSMRDGPVLLPKSNDAKHGSPCVLTGPQETIEGGYIEKTIRDPHLHPGGAVDFGCSGMAKE
jgi:hypothetical protein